MGGSGVNVVRRAWTYCKGVPAAAGGGVASDDRGCSNDALTAEPVVSRADDPSSGTAPYAGGRLESTMESSCEPMLGSEMGKQPPATAVVGDRDRSNDTAVDTQVAPGPPIPPGVSAASAVDDVSPANQDSSCSKRLTTGVESVAPPGAHSPTAAAAVAPVDPCSSSLSRAQRLLRRNSSGSTPTQLPDAISHSMAPKPVLDSEADGSPAAAAAPATAPAPAPAAAAAAASNGVGGETHAPRPRPSSFPLSTPPMDRILTAESGGAACGAGGAIGATAAPATAPPAMTSERNDQSQQPSNSTATLAAAKRRPPDAVLRPPSAMDGISPAVPVGLPGRGLVDASAALATQPSTALTVATPGRPGVKPLAPAPWTGSTLRMPVSGSGGVCAVGVVPAPNSCAGYVDRNPYLGLNGGRRDVPIFWRQPSRPPPPPPVAAFGPRSPTRGSSVGERAVIAQAIRVGGRVDEVSMRLGSVSEALSLLEDVAILPALRRVSDAVQAELDQRPETKAKNHAANRIERVRIVPRDFEREEWE